MKQNKNQTKSEEGFTCKTKQKETRSKKSQKLFWKNKAVRNIKTIYLNVEKSRDLIHNLI